MLTFDFLSFRYTGFYLGCQSCIFGNRFLLWTDSRMSKTKTRTIDQTRKNTKIHEKICSYMFTIENTTNITENGRIRAENEWFLAKVVEIGEKWRKISEIGRKVTKKHKKMLSDITGILIVCLWFRSRSCSRTYAGDLIWPHVNVIQLMATFDLEKHLFNKYDLEWPQLWRY